MIYDEFKTPSTPFKKLTVIFLDKPLVWLHSDNEWQLFQSHVWMSKVRVTGRHCQVLKMHDLLETHLCLIWIWMWIILVGYGCFQARGEPIVWPTAIIMIMKTASNTSMQQIAIATIISRLSVELTEEQKREWVAELFGRLRPSEGCNVAGGKVNCNYPGKFT